jgi:hypothetical protein
MMKYILLFCRDPQDVEAWEALPEEERAQHAGRVGQCLAEHRSQIRGDHHLHASYTATSVYFIPNGQPLFTAGPFFAEIEVADLDEALELAKTWPLRRPALGVVEIRPLVE